MIMKKYFLIVLLFTGLFTACEEEVLEKKPLDIISEVDVWNDQALIDAYLYQCYNMMGFINEMEFGGNRVWFEMTLQTLIADECIAGWQSGLKSFQINENTNTGGWWGYSLVRKLNIFLEKLPSAPVESSFIKKRSAEARYLRAHAYFNMVKRYGGVPLITKSQSITDSEEELFVKRDSEAAVYDFILSELDAILNDLPDVANDGGRPTRYTVLALKSRAAMYAASIASWGKIQLDGTVGIPAAKTGQYWQASYDASRAIISSGKFALYNKFPEDKAKNFRQIFLDENNSEVIFSERYDGLSGKGHSIDFFFAPFGYHPWPGNGSQGSAYLEMVESFDNKDGTPGVIDRNKITQGYLWTAIELFGNKDPRFHASILTLGSPWLGQTIENYKGIIKEDGSVTLATYKGVLANGKAAATRGVATPFTVAKYLDEPIHIVPVLGTSKTDWIVFRYAETLLNLAEAAWELKKPDEALDAVNQLRIRAGIASLSSVDRDKIRKERKVELAFEGNRYWDVRRWRTAETDLSIPFSSVKFELDYTTRKYRVQIIKNQDGLPTPQFAERHYYLPITLNRIKNNPNLVENPGYTN